MGYSKDRVNWTEEEHKAAEAADTLYELWKGQLSNGVGADDIAALPLSWVPASQLFQHLFSGERKDLARNLISLGVMLERDNDFLGVDDDGNGGGNAG